MQGLLVINKPKGITSFGVVAFLRKILGEKRIGHTGTLDPLASGVLIVLIGRPCVLSDYIMGGTKSYVASLRLGIKTDTYDITGEIVKSSDKKVSKDEFTTVLNSFLGESLQTPPMFSAKKVEGKKLYELAREGKEVFRKQTAINIFEIKLLSFKDNEAEILVTCSKGTYIRSLIDDIGEKLGSFATMTDLVRIENGGFSINEAIDMNSLSADNVGEYILSSEKAVSQYKTVNVTGKQAIRFFNGGELDVNRLHNVLLNENEIVRVKYIDKFVGLGKRVGDSLKVLCPIENPNL